MDPMDWDAIAGLLPAALIMAMILRRALRRRPHRDSPSARPRRPADEFRREYEPIEPR